MEYHTRLEQFKLVELKNIFKHFQNEYGLLSFLKIYTLNKFDLICLLRNSKCFEECYSNHIVFKCGRVKIKLIPKPKKTIYRGEQVKHLTKFRKDVTIDFE